MTTSDASTLSTTHFALLSLLSARDWSAYELVEQMGRSVGAVWPRAKSNLYADLKRLAREGLADAAEAPSRGPTRTRTTYRITASGREQLASWMATPGATPAFECEALLKLGFSPASTKESALAQVGVIAAHATERIAFGRMLAEQHAASDGPLPERLHINAVMWRFLWDQHQMMLRWAEWARAEIEQWPSTTDSPELRRRGRAVLAAAIRPEE